MMPLRFLGTVFLGPPDKRTLPRQRRSRAKELTLEEWDSSSFGLTVLECAAVLHDVPSLGGLERAEWLERDGLSRPLS
jgi:hypothetical protein